MISKLYENQIGTLLTMLLIFVAAAVGEYYFFQNQLSIPENNGLLQSFFAGLNEIAALSFSIKLILVVLEGLLLNQLCTQYNIADESGYSVLSFYIFSYLIFPRQLLLNQMDLGIFLVFLGIIFLYKYLKENYKKTHLFLSGFFLGFAALFIPEFFWSIALLLGGVLIFKSINTGDVIVIIFGLYMPYYLIASLGYLFSTELNFMNVWKYWRVNQVTETLSWGKNGMDWILILSFIAISIVGAMKFYGAYFRYNVETRRSKLALAVIAGFIVMVFIFRSKQYENYFSLLAMPFSVYSSSFFEGRKLLFWKNLVIFVMVVLSIYKLYLQLFQIQ